MVYRINLIYTLSVAQQSFILRILLINQWYIESQKPLATLFMSQKMGKTSAIAKFQNLIGKAIFMCPGKTFTSYVPSCTRICRRNRIVYKKPNVSRDSSGVLYYCRMPHRKTTNGFSILEHHDDD